jgi:hypothetical protein
VKIEDILETLNGLPVKQREEILTEAMASTKNKLWVPNPGPQTEAYFSEADEVFYGGSAGSGKTQLLIGLALNEHRRSLILRRTNKEAQGLAEQMVEVVGTRDGYNSQTGFWRLDGRLVELGGCQLEEDKQKYKGNPKSLICFDEVSDFSETQYTFVIGWNRSADPNERCRVVAAGNPPTRPEGLWVVRRWAAWLDPTHHKPAQPGELRWYTTDPDTGEELEVEGRGPHHIGEQEVFARSRTFIPGKLSDNPDLAATNYKASLDALPEELRAAYRDGDFGTGLRDDAYQAVPTAWIREAQARWEPRPPVGVPMCSIGVDVAQGGDDQTVLAPRYDGWYPPLIVVAGKLTPSGKEVAGLVVAQRRDQAVVVVDLGGGWGGDTYGHLKENQIPAVGYMGVKPSTRRDKDGKWRFFNTRAEAYWRFREALDPSQEQGSAVALPRDAELVADLCAPRYQIVSPNTLKLESKEDVTKRIGRSPDKGDAVVMAWWEGNKSANVEGGWRKRNSALPKVIMRRVKRRG